MNKLALQTLGTFLIGAITLGLLLFLPAGTLNYWQAWVFILVFLISMNAIGVYLSLKDPTLGAAIIPFAIADIMLAPFVEENIYRGYGMTKLLPRFGATGAILLSSLFFGLLHWSGGF